MVEEFEINAFTATLSEIDKKNNLHIIDNGKWIVPVYQRPYSWKEDQISRFLRDLKSGFNGEGGQSLPMFIGTMQFSDLKKGSRDIIDGQQRLTTFLLLIDALNDLDFSINSNIPTDWLYSKVNDGVAQLNLEEVLGSDYSSLLLLGNYNPYARAKKLILESLNNWSISDSDEGDFDILNFQHYIRKQVYFVCIETKATLSKTLKIFESINATGMDLNAGDLFKVNFYEYLRVKKNKSESIFDQISNIYAEIDLANKKSTTGHVTDINDILDIYRYILISKYDLPKSLYGLGIGTFYERLFNKIINGVKSEGFSEAANKVDLSLEDLVSILRLRIKWHNSFGLSAEVDMAYYFIVWSRYRRYWISVIIFEFVFENESQKREQNEFLINFFKILWLYSVSYAKAVNECHRFVREVFKELFHTKDSGKILNMLEVKIKTFHGNSEKATRLNHKLSQPITDNHIHKNLICRLAGMLDEDYKSNDRSQIIEQVQNLFRTSIDIEHIQSYHAFEIEKRELVWGEWGEEINCLGNLVVLESAINRRIGNLPFPDKQREYEKSGLKTVKQLVSGADIWTLENALERKKSEINKILTYIFNG